MSLEEPALGTARGSALPGHFGLGGAQQCQLWGHSRAAKGTGQSCHAAGVRPAPQLIPAPLEEQEQADELRSKTHCLMLDLTQGQLEAFLHLAESLQHERCSSESISP